MDLLKHEKLLELIEKHNINLVNFIFIGFTIVIVLFGSLMTLVEQQLPTFIRQSFRYGKHSHKGKSDKIVTIMEVPKSWFKHFYIFAITFVLLAVYLLIDAIVRQSEAPEYVLRFLDFMAGGQANRRVALDSNTAFVGTLLMTMQCIRRFYETNFVQIFSKSSKMNLSHYMVGYLHYYGSIIALLSNTEGFVRGSQPSQFTLESMRWPQIICILIFIASWYQQYNANMILVNLRIDVKTGKVKTEQHLMPTGGSFKYVSSPHMLFEIIMYCCLTTIMFKSTTWLLIAFWVISNQTSNAMLTHQWYKDQFKQYPKMRRALIPFIL